MPRGELVALRARHSEDVPVIAAMHADVTGTARSAPLPWRPIPPGAATPWDVREPTESAAHFSVVTLDGGELAGRASLWGIDTFHRGAHIGIRLRPEFHGRGLGTDVVGVLCHYGFVVLGLHRLQIETFTDNRAMLKAAERNGFVREAVVRHSSWVMGAFADDCVLGLLADEWGQRRRAA